MKKKVPNCSKIRRGIHNVVLVTGILLLALSAAQASPDLDRQYQLETIGFLRPSDNVDGLFTEYVTTAFQDFFSRQSRFILNDISKVDSILTYSKLPYHKIIYDSEVLQQLARSARTESLIRTKIMKLGDKYQFTLDWLHAPRMEIMATVTFDLELSDQGKLSSPQISAALWNQLGRLISQVPFFGSVTGHDHRSVTINMGHFANLKRGDVLYIGTLDEVKKHPLLNTIVGWGITPIGKIVVEKPEDAMSFCRILRLQSGRQISRYQKIVKVESSALLDSAEAPKTDPLQPWGPPTTGWVGVSPLLGSYQRQFNTPSASVANQGGGFMYGAKAEAEVWITREWFAHVQVSNSFWSFSQQDSPTGTLSPVSQTGGIPGSVFSLRLEGGYSYLFTGDFFGPKGWLKLGYKSNTYSLAANVTENTGSLSVNSAFLGIGGDLPLFQDWGALLNFNFRAFSFVNQTWLNATPLGASDFDFFIAGYYRVTPRITFRLGFELNSNGAEFSEGSNLSQNTMTIEPALLYYF